MRKKVISSLVVALLLFSGCDDDNTTEKRSQAVNKAPIVDAGENRVVTVNKTITLMGSATDSDGEIVSYEWKKGEETLSDEKSLSYLPTDIGIDILIFTAMDDDGDSSSDTIKITVKAEENSSDESTNVEDNSSNEEIVIKNDFS